METITVNVDPSLAAYARQLVEDGTYTSVSDVVATLLEEDRCRRQATIAELLREGLADRGGPMTDADWNAMRNQYRDRHGMANGS